MIITSKCGQVFNTDNILAVEGITKKNDKIHWLWHVGAFIVFIPLAIITIVYNIMQEDYYETILTFRDEPSRVFKLDCFGYDILRCYEFV